MTRIVKLGLAVAVTIAIAACGSDGGTVTSTDESDAGTGNGIAVENAFYFTHVDGHSNETERVAFVLFEHEQLRNVKYQVAYIACTCRSPDVNYYSVAYVELSKSDGSVEFISYSNDSTDNYTAGLYGDSVISYDGTPVQEPFIGYLADTIVGSPQETINAIEPMHGNVDGFTGATVTPNNAVRMLQGLFEYHNTKYL